jgi:hypothetical protein
MSTAKLPYRNVDSALSNINLVIRLKSSIMELALEVKASGNLNLTHSSKDFGSK